MAASSAATTKSTRSRKSPSSGGGPRRPRQRPSQTRTALAYDANGNLLDDGEYLYTWDAFNRLVEARLKRNSRIVGQYFYDAMHRRTKRLANLDGNASLETQVAYIYDAFNCISEISNSGSEIKDYVWGNDINGGPQAAGGVGGLVAVLSFSPQPSAYYPLFDARGNVTAYTGSSGSVAASFDYLPFGALVNSTGNADAFSYRFSTKPFDPETGLVYYNFRYYSPELGRWMGRDPVGEWRADNLYAFLRRNLNSFDYLGLSDLDIDPPSAINAPWYWMTHNPRKIGWLKRLAYDGSCKCNEETCYVKCKIIAHYEIRISVIFQKGEYNIHHQSGQFTWYEVISINGTYGHEQKHLDAYIKGLNKLSVELEGWEKKYSTKTACKSAAASAEDHRSTIMTRLWVDNGTHNIDRNPDVPETGILYDPIGIMPVNPGSDAVRPNPDEDPFRD